MLYFLAIIVPPVAVLMVGKPIQALLNLVLTLLGWIPGVVHAFLVINSHKADRRNEKVIKAMKRNSKP